MPRQPSFKMLMRRQRKLNNVRRPLLPDSDMCFITLTFRVFQTITIHNEVLLHLNRFLTNHIPIPSKTQLAGSGAGIGVLVGVGVVGTIKVVGVES